MSRILKVFKIFFRNVEEVAIERHWSWVPVDKETNKGASELKNHLTARLGLKEHAYQYGIGGFSLKWFRLAKSSAGKCENFAVAMDGHWQLQLPNLLWDESSSDLNGKYWTLYTRWAVKVLCAWHVVLSGPSTLFITPKMSLKRDFDSLKKTLSSQPVVSIQICGRRLSYPGVWEITEKNNLTSMRQIRMTRNQNLKKIQNLSTDLVGELFSSDKVFFKNLKWKTIQYNERITAKKFLDYFQWVYLWGLSLDSSVFNRNLPLKSKIINLTHQRFGFRVLYSCILSICLDNYQLRPASKSYQRWKETRKCKMTSVS